MSSLRVGLRGDPTTVLYPQLVRGKVIKAVLRYFIENPGLVFCMVRISLAELRMLERSGVIFGCLGQPRSHKTNTHRWGQIEFDSSGKTWVVFHRDCGCIDPFSGKYWPGYDPTDFRRRVKAAHGNGDPSAYPWPAPRCLIVPQIPGDLPCIDADEADANGAFLWEAWEYSTGLTDDAAAFDAEISAQAVCTFWGEHRTAIIPGPSGGSQASASA